MRWCRGSSSRDMGEGGEEDLEFTKKNIFCGEGKRCITFDDDRQSNFCSNSGVVGSST